MSSKTPAVPDREPDDVVTFENSGFAIEVYRLADIDTPFGPTFDLVSAGEILATLFWDPAPEVAHLEDIEVEVAGERRTVPAAEAGYDEDTVGWCLYFTDKPRYVDRVKGEDPERPNGALAIACARLAKRIGERGVWHPRAGHLRLWGERVDE